MRTRNKAKKEAAVAGTQVEHVQYSPKSTRKHEASDGPKDGPKDGVRKRTSKKNARSRALSPKQIKSLEQMAETHTYSEGSTSTSVSTVVKDPMDATTGTAGHEMDVDEPMFATQVAMDNPTVDTPDVAVEDPGADTSMSAPDVVEDPTVHPPMSDTLVVLEAPNGTCSGSVTLEVDTNSSTLPPDVVVTNTPIATKEHEMGVDPLSCAPDVALTEDTDVYMVDAETPTSHSTTHNSFLSSQEHATEESCVEAFTSTTSSSHCPNVPFTLIHVWEDHYTPEDPSNWTNTQPRGVPDNTVAIPSYLFQEFLSLLTLHGHAPPVPDVPSTAVAEETSSDASNTPRRARMRSATRSALRFAPSTPLSPIPEESPNFASKSPALDRLIKEAGVRKDSTPGVRVDASENDLVIETTSPASGSTPALVTDSVTARASATLLCARKSPTTVAQIDEDVMTKGRSTTKVELKSNKLISKSTGKSIKHKPAASLSDDGTPRALTPGVRSDGSSFDTPFRYRLGLSAYEQRMQLRSEQTQYYDKDGNLDLLGGGAIALLTELGGGNDSDESGDEDLAFLARANRFTDQARSRKQGTEDMEVSRSSTKYFATSEPNTKAVNDNQEIAAGQTQIPQPALEIGNGQLIATTPAPTTPAPTTPRRGWNIGSLLNSARSVSKLIPGFGPSTPAQPLVASSVADHTASTNSSDSTQLALPALENTDASDSRQLAQAIPENMNTSISRQLAQPIPENTDTSISRQLALPVPRSRTPSSAPQRSRATQTPTQPRRRAPATAGPSHGTRLAAAPKTFRTQKDMEEQKLTYTMRAARRQKQKEDDEYKEKIEEAKKAAEDLRKEEAKKAAEDLRKEEEKAAVPGKKRKRRRSPSPDVIPNPPGGGYGMYEKYFYLTSSEEDDEDEEDIDTSTQKGKGRANDSDEQPRTKRTKVTEEQDENEAAADHHDESPRGRTSYRVDPEPFSHVVIGDPHRAQPYTGTLFLLPPSSNPSLYHGGNVFEQADTAKKQADSAETATSIPSPTSSTSSINFFTVPYSDSEDDDEDETEEQDSQAGLETPKFANATDVDVTTPRSVNSMIIDTPTPKSVTNMDVGTPTPQQAGSRSAADIAYIDKIFGALKGVPSELEPAISSSSQTPPHPSSSANDTLPASNGAIDTTALARVRSQALKYTPKQPSGLRAQSRLSTSTVGSDVGENVDEVLAGPETPAASQDTSHAAESQQGGDDTIGPQENAMVGAGKEGEQQSSAGTVAGGGQQPSSSWMMEGMDDEARAAVEAIPENELIQFEFPAMRSYTDQGLIDPEVEAYLNANWTEADTARAERSFEVNLEAFMAEQRFVASATP